MFYSNPDPTTFALKLTLYIINSLVYIHFNDGLSFGWIGWTTSWPDPHQLPWLISKHLAVNQRSECSFGPLSLPYPSLPRDYPRCWASLSLTEMNGICSHWWSEVHVLQERDTQAWTRTRLSMKGNIVSVQTGLAPALRWWILAIEIESQLKSLISNTCPRVLSNYFCFPRWMVMLSPLWLLSENYIHGYLK